jgi:hypothetical protein
MNGTFRVVYSLAVQAALNELLRRAAEQDRKLGEDALAAVKTLDERLKADPMTFGEPRYQLHHLRLEVRIGVQPPLAVSFAVHATEPVVFVTGFRLLTWEA